MRLPPPPRGLVPRPPPVPYSFRPRGARFRPCWGSCAGSRVGVGTAPWSRSRAPPGRGPPGAAVLAVGSRRGARGGPHTGTANRGTRGLPWKAAGVRGARQGCRCLPRQAVPARPPPQSHASHVCSRATHQLLGVTVALRALGRGCLPPRGTLLARTAPRGPPPAVPSQQPVYVGSRGASLRDRSRPGGART